MSDVLTTLSREMASATAAAGQSTVSVSARRHTPGSGIIYSSDGVIVTANHIIERDDNIQVGLADGSTHSATLIGRDPTTDLALLRVNGTNMRAATWTAASDLLVGQLVLAVGRPGANIQATLGVISALEEGWRTGGGGMIDQYIQNDVLMYPGFSGGPLLAADGSFIGLNSSALVRGASVTIPAATVARVAQTVLQHGHVKRGYLGVSAQPVKLPTALAKSLGQETGLLIASVESGSPAETAGLLLGDTLVTFAGVTIGNMDDLMAALSSEGIGTSVEARIIRGGEVHQQSVIIGERG